MKYEGNTKEAKLQDIFVAYASGNGFQQTVIEEAAKTASTPQRKITPWSRLDASGHPIQSSVEGWVEKCSAFVADISIPNHNVIYELGLAIGWQKPFRLVRSKRMNFTSVRDIGLIDTLAHDSYDFQQSLVAIFRQDLPKNRWAAAKRNLQQPIFVLQPPRPMDWAQKATSAVKKVARLKFRNFNPSEVSRLTANELFEMVSSSFGCVLFWMDDQSPSAFRHNHRTALAYGFAKALEIPAVLIAHQSSKLPLDVHDIADRWEHLEQIDDLIENLRNEVLEEILAHSDQHGHEKLIGLEAINLGEPIAENEQSILGSVFLETEAFSRALHGQSNVLIGRKGSGKSAIFLQVRDIMRADKSNIVIDLMPEGYSLIKFKEYILDYVGYGTRKEIVSAFWQYVIWLEIAYKILEKDALRAKHDHETMVRFQKLEEAFLARVDTGKGDFSERLQKLSDNITRRFQTQIEGDAQDQIKSSKILEIIYGYGIKDIRDQIIEYLDHKGLVFFLFDNLDRFWTPGGYDQDDATIVVGLAEAMQEIQRRFRKDGKDFRWVIFVRSDVYEFLVAGMADYGKLATRSIEWSDREQIKALLNLRIKYAAADIHSNASITLISDPFVFGKEVLDFLVDASLMRPRYLIRLIETARRRAMTLGHSKINEDDYEYALKELGFQVLEDLDRECRDLMPDSSELIFELLSMRDNLTADKVRYIAQKCIQNNEQLQSLIDILIWSGALGVIEKGQPRFIYDTGYKRQYLSSIIKNNPDVEIVIHPTLCATAE